MNFTHTASKVTLLFLMIIGSNLPSYANPSNYPSIDDELGKMLVQGMGNLLNEYNPNNPDYPTFTDEHYKARFLEMSGAIQYRLTPEIKNHIIHRTERYRSATERTLGLTEVYFPIFEEYLAEKNIPHQIKYLPIVESNLNGVARSHAAAVGLWQFIPGTAKLYGLTVSSHLDERSDTHKASEAAANMLSKLYKRYGDWPLALAAYNCGPGRVDRYVRGTNKDFWDIRSLLPRETQMYVPYFMAVTYSYEYQHLHEFSIKKQHTDYVLTDSIHLTPGYKTLTDLSRYYGLGRDTLKRLNPSYIKNYVPSSGSNHILVLPARIVAKHRNYEAAYQRIMNMRSENPIKCIRRVNNEYELRKMMRAHRFSREDVLFWNGLPANYTFRKGDIIAVRKYHVPKDVWAKQFIPPTIESISIASLQVVGLDNEKKCALTAPVYTTIKNKKATNKSNTPALAATNKSKKARKTTSANPYQLSNKVTALTPQRAKPSTVIGQVSEDRTRQRRLRNSSASSTDKATIVVTKPTASAPVTMKEQPKQVASLQMLAKQSAGLYNKERAATKATVFIATTMTKEEKQALAYLKAQSNKLVQQETAKAKLVKAVADKKAEAARVAKVEAEKQAEATRQAEAARIAKFEADKKVKAVQQVQKAMPLNTTNFETYTVQKNETIWEIQRRYPRTNAREILMLNNLTSRDILREGTQLKIPVQ